MQRPKVVWKNCFFFVISIQMRNFLYPWSIEIALTAYPNTPPVINWTRWASQQLDVVLSVECGNAVWLGQSLILQVAKKASVLKRRKSRNKMEAPGAAGAAIGGGPGAEKGLPSGDGRRESEGDVVFYVEEPKAGRK